MAGKPLLFLDTQVTKAKPWWLRLVTGERTWVTIYPYIYVPKGETDESVLAHEIVHLERQKALGKWKWLWRYFTSREFRFREEVLGIVVQLRMSSNFLADLQWHSERLAGPTYRHAARSVEEARLAILEEM